MIIRARSCTSYDYVMSYCNDMCMHVTGLTVDINLLKCERGSSLIVAIS